MNRILLLLMVMLLASITYPAVAQDTDGKTDNSSVQQNKSSDFDNWYEPDDAYKSNDQNQQPTTNTVSPKGGVDEPRVAPLKDTRSKVQ